MSWDSVRFGEDTLRVVQAAGLCSETEESDLFTGESRKLTMKNGTGTECR